MAQGDAAVWHGSEEELRKLCKAVEHACTCDPDRQVLCPPHKMLLSDQKVLDHMAFGAALRRRFIKREFRGR